jgi:hypothetical protein
MSLSCGCDYEGNYGSRPRTARKLHQCEECGQTIQPGEVYEFHTFFGSDYISNHKTCERCTDLADSMVASGFCWPFGELHELHAEYIAAYDPPVMAHYPR